MSYGQLVYIEFWAQIIMREIATIGAYALLNICSFLWLSFSK